MMFRVLSFYAESLIGGYFLWLGLYIITRGLPFFPDKKNNQVWWQSATFAAGISFIFASWFIFGIAMRSVVLEPDQYLFWLRICWWTAPIALVTWLRAIWLLPSPQAHLFSKSRRFHWFFWVLLVGAVGLAYWGTFTELIFRYSAILPLTSNWSDRFYVPPSPQNSLFLLFMLFVLVASFGLLGYRYRQSPKESKLRYEYRLLAVGTGLFVVGAAFGVSAYSWWQSAWGEHFGYSIATAGIMLLGRGVVRYNALVAQKVVHQDSVHALLETGIVIGGYLLVVNGAFWLIGVEMPAILVPVLIYLVTISTVPMGWYKWVVDRWTLPAWQTNFLWRLARVRQEVMTAPNKQEALTLAFNELSSSTQEAQLEQIRVMIHEEIAGIFRHKVFHQDSAMANSRLFQLNIVQQTLLAYCQTNKLIPSLLTEWENAGILRHFFAEFMKTHFSPPTTQTPSDKQIESLLLFKSYVENKTRRQVILEIEKEAGLRIAGNGTGGRLYAQYLNAGRTHLGDKIWHQECLVHSQ
jgi:hypothetical protein